MTPTIPNTADAVAPIVELRDLLANIVGMAEDMREANPDLTVNDIVGIVADGTGAGADVDDIMEALINLICAWA